MQGIGDRTDKSGRSGAARFGKLALLRRGDVWSRALAGCLAFTLAVVGRLTAQDRNAPGPTSRLMLAEFYEPPAEFADRFGEYRSPLLFENGQAVASADEWPKRRQEILRAWHRRLGPWPPLIDRPSVKIGEEESREGYSRYRVEIAALPGGTSVSGYLCRPPGTGPFPAVLVPFYEPLTSVGEGDRGQGTHDYGRQLARLGFVTLSIGTPEAEDDARADTRRALTQAGAKYERQPLTLLAYVAANCHTALAQMPDIDPQRIGIIGLSYGGKWAMFASCLYDKFACAVWSDPGIVFDETNANVNYWEPWYLGYDPAVTRTPGLPTVENPRTGLYKSMIDNREDLVDLHALMAPRPVLVSGGTEDPPHHWIALNHLLAVNRLLGFEQRVALTARATHIPTPGALQQELAFLEYWLKQQPRP